MRRTIEFGNRELVAALREHFKIKGRITYWYIRSVLGKEEVGHSIEYEE